MEISVNDFLKIKLIKTTCGEEKETQFGINCDGMYFYTTDSRYLHKAQKLIARCPAMAKSISETHNTDKETTSIDIELDERFTNPSLFKIKRTRI